MLTVDPDGPSGPIAPIDAGELTLSADGTFTFAPVLDFNDYAGPVTFTARNTDTPGDPDLQLVNSTPLTVTLNVTPEMIRGNQLSRSGRHHTADQ